MDVATAQYEIGIRAEGQAVKQHLAEAVAAYSEALQVRTRELHPQNWAMTQNYLGNALREQGIRTGGEEGRRLLAEVVAAYRQALTVYTREQYPLNWPIYRSGEIFGGSWAYRTLTFSPKHIRE